jgi:hypothetical protein
MNVLWPITVIKSTMICCSLLLAANRWGRKFEFFNRIGRKWRYGSFPPTGHWQILSELIDGCFAALVRLDNPGQHLPLADPNIRHAECLMEPRKRTLFPPFNRCILRNNPLTDCPSRSVHYLWGSEHGAG